eukprot:3950930-Prorocentrum_lima.AAC.1
MYKQQVGEITDKTQKEKQVALQKIVDSTRSRAMAEIQENTSSIESAAREQALYYEDALKQRANLEMQACRMMAES